VTGVRGRGELTPCLSLSALKMIYHSPFHSVMSYGIMFWGNSPNSPVIFEIQKGVVRILMGSVFISLFNQLDAQNLFHKKFYFMSLHVSSTCAHHQEVKTALHILWFHHTYRCEAV